MAFIKNVSAAFLLAGSAIGCMPPAVTPKEESMILLFCEQAGNTPDGTPDNKLRYKGELGSFAHVAIGSGSSISRSFIAVSSSKTGGTFPTDNAALCIFKAPDGIKVSCTSGADTLSISVVRQFSAVRGISYMDGVFETPPLAILGGDVNSVSLKGPMTCTLTAQ
jgi:hypothetical protein